MINIKFLFKKYWIYENKVIFKPDFNDKLDDYIDIISKHNELIFSNYDDCIITIKTNNKYCEEYYKYDKKYKISKFNKLVIIPQNVTHLTFGSYFIFFIIFIIFLTIFIICFNCYNTIIIIRKY